MNEESISYLPTTGSSYAMAINTAENSSDVGKQVKIAFARDIVDARQKGRILAQEIGASSTQATLVATVISELARNIILYAGSGDIYVKKAHSEKTTGIEIVAVDRGPGIENISRAMMNGFSTSGGLGLGLSGVKQIADSFQISSELNQGVRVEVIMWLVKN
ncbi:MAG: ATP-binding protein [Pseudohongiella sp.]|nr:ATP-binding protein [Pseudohongiella sp.]